ncbi:MAG: hypothetical protein AAF533_15610 [Acidobacteriota bacterium]
MHEVTGWDKLKTWLLPPFAVWLVLFGEDWHRQEHRGRYDAHHRADVLWGNTLERDFDSCFDEAYSLWRLPKESLVDHERLSRCLRLARWRMELSPGCEGDPACLRVLLKDLDGCLAQSQRRDGAGGWHVDRVVLGECLHLEHQWELLVGG